MVASGLSILLLTTAPQLIHGLALPAGWKPQLGLPAGISLQNGFLGTEADKWRRRLTFQSPFLRARVAMDAECVDAVRRPRCKMANDKFRQVCFYRHLWPTEGRRARGLLERSDYYEETLALPLVGASCFNRWVVHGYVSETQRVCRSTDGNNYGFWCLHTLETDRCTASKFCQTVLPSNGAMLQLTFEKGAA